ncbi:ParA family protein [Borrelia crocidurae]|uniref:PF32 plasmid partition protein n=1 Tax=Borrelia crocidurae (strain Achema) TaxID=1155096 RepID=I0FF81_BORCA|nr:ParA family protein [Borrelia crocidurae]AFI32137.1 PF32 plasmid partition protein [Borrelia crocidurae str. Achema]
MDKKKPKVITIASIKGGVGKSVMAIVFSYILEDMNKKVLLIDLDPQNSITSYFIKYINNIEEFNVYSLLKEEYDYNFDKYLSVINHNMYLIASHPMLGNFEQESIEYKELLLEFCLKENLANYDFDYVIIDTAPNSKVLLYNALNITDILVVPIETERWSVETFPQILKSVKKTEIIKNRKIEIAIIKNKFIKNRNTLRDIEVLLNENYRDLVKGKVHFSNGVRVFINELLVPDKSEKYYKEIKDALNNIITYK